jgi:hypothetical protein
MNGLRMKFNAATSGLHCRHAAGNFPFSTEFTNRGESLSACVNLMPVTCFKNPVPVAGMAGEDLSLLQWHASSRQNVLLESITKTP